MLECVLWEGSVHPRGYGVFRVPGEPPVLAHRAMYEAFYGDIPARHDVHHTCEVKDCVNPYHLMAMTRKAHLRLHAGPLCPKGHVKAEVGRHMICRKCHSDREAARMRRVRASRAMEVE